MEAARAHRGGAFHARIGRRDAAGHSADGYDRDQAGLATGEIKAPETLAHTSPGRVGPGSPRALHSRTSPPGSGPVNASSRDVASRHHDRAPLPPGRRRRQGPRRWTARGTILATGGGMGGRPSRGCHHGNGAIPAPTRLDAREPSNRCTRTEGFTALMSRSAGARRRGNGGPGCASARSSSAPGGRDARIPPDGPRPYNPRPLYPAPPLGYALIGTSSLWRQSDGIEPWPRVLVAPGAFSSAGPTAPPRALKPPRYHAPEGRRIRQTHPAGPRSLVMA